MKKNILIPALFATALVFTACTDDSGDDNLNNSANLQADIAEVTANATSGGAWVITNFVDSGENETAHFNGYGFSFNEDGSLVADNGTNTVTGTWSITADDNSSDDSSSDDSTIDDCSNCTIEHLAEVLSTCENWFVDKLEINDDKLEDSFNGFSFNFSSDRGITATNGSNTYMGSWSASGSGNSITFVLTFPDYPNLEASWTVHEIDLHQGESYVDFRVGDNRLRFKNGCTIGTFSGGTSSGEIDFNIFFASPANFSELSEDWDIVSHSSTKLELIHVSGGNGGTDLLTFEKN